MLLDATLAGPVPAPFVAATTNVYAVPLVSPVTVIGDAPVPVMLPGEDVAVYAVIAALPVSEGAVYATVAVPDPAAPAVAVPIVGAPGLLGQIPCLV
jgi:hypothetical protein